MKRAIGGAFLLVFFLVARPVNASVFINEFLIDPAPQQVELFNNGSEEVDISGFFIDDSGGSTYFIVPEGTKIAGKSCAVFSHDFNFNKTTADSVRLFDKTAPPTSEDAHLVDSYSYESSAGEGISYQRTPDGEGEWSTKNETLGKKNEDGSSCTSAVTPPPAGGPAGVPPSYENIYISEAFVHPGGGENEWVELYNDNDFEVTLTRWYIDDSPTEGSSPKEFALTIPAKSYAVYTLSSSLFNNDGDTITLLDAEKNIKHQISYEASEEERTVGPASISSQDVCFRYPTKNRPNGDCIAAATSPTKSPTPTKTPAPTKKAESKNVAAVKNLPRSTKHSSHNTPASSAGDLPKSPKVLGATEKKNQPAILLVKTLSFLGIFYALLASSSIVYKLRKKPSLKT